MEGLSTLPIDPLLTTSKSDSNHALSAVAKIPKWDDGILFRIPSSPLRDLFLFRYHDLLHIAFTVVSGGDEEIDTGR